MNGFRKLFVTLVGIGCLMTGIFSGHIPGATGAWAIVSVIGASMGGFAGEYFGNQRKAKAPEDKSKNN